VYFEGNARFFLRYAQDRLRLLRMTVPTGFPAAWVSPALPIPWWAAELKTNSALQHRNFLFFQQGFLNVRLFTFALCLLIFLCGSPALHTRL
jgi:hypothetical protein